MADKTASEIAAEEAKREISKAQFEAVKRAAAEDNVFFDTDPSDDGSAPDFVWQAHHILVAGDFDWKSNDYLKELRAELAPNVDGSNQETAPDRAILLRINADVPVRQVVDTLTMKYRLIGKVGLNNLLSICPVAMCPADEPGPIRPYPATLPYPPPGSDDAGHHVSVRLVDVGLSPGWEIDHPWLYDAARHPPTEVSGDLFPAIGPNSEIERYAGHSVFIAGVMRCVAPRVQVKVHNGMWWAGSMLEFPIANILHAILDESPQPDIICLPAGCTTVNGLPPVAMTDVLNRLKAPGCQTLLIAAAGNDGKGPGSGPSGTFYPAAFAGPDPYVINPVVVSVGAVREDRAGRTCFSNYGNWVHVYEDGERLINAFPIGKYTYHEPLSSAAPPVCVYHPGLETGCTCVTAPAKGTIVQFNGMAEWSGTSFAAPIIAGRVARYMTENALAGQPREAWKQVRQQMDGISDKSDGIPLNVFPFPAGG
jgi:subtilase family protein